MPNPASSAADGRLVPASLTIRIAAMVYDGLLLFGVVFIVSYALLAALGWSHPLATGQRAVLQAALFLAIGAYFVVSWSRSGQTLALRTWRLRVVDESGRPPGRRRAAVRYLAAWHLWIPGLAIAALLDGGLGVRLAVLVAGFTVLLIPAVIDRERRLLHDRWTGTRVIKV